MMEMGGNGTSIPGNGRWLLPEGIEELLPAEARTVERMLHHMLSPIGWGMAAFCKAGMQLNKHGVSGRTQPV